MIVLNQEDGAPSEDTGTEEGADAGAATEAAPAEESTEGEAASE